MLINLFHTLFTSSAIDHLQAKLQTPALPPVTAVDKELPLLIASRRHRIGLDLPKPTAYYRNLITSLHIYHAFSYPSHKLHSTTISHHTVQKLQQRHLTSNKTTHNMPQLQPSDPSSMMVIRDITPNITTFSLPFARFGVVKVGGRATLGMFSLSALLPPKAKG